MQVISLKAVVCHDNSLTCLFVTGDYERIAYIFTRTLQRDVQDRYILPV